jgi:opacity protein-like surface antigen
MKAFFYGVLSMAALMFALSSVYAQDDYKWEGFGGYSYMNLNRGIRPEDVGSQVTNFPGNRVNAHGFNGSFTYNFHRYLGAKFDLTLSAQGNNNFTSPLQINPAPPVTATFKTSQDIQQYLFGVQVKDNKKESQHFKPWAHILMGPAHQHLVLDETAPGSATIFDASKTDFAMKFGGGLDWGVHKNIDIRLIQFDWNPIFRSSINTGGTLGTLPGRIENNYIFTWGVAIHN